MESIFSYLVHLNAARVLFGAIAGSMSGIALLLAFIIGRRWVRGRYFRRRDAIAAAIRRQWDFLVAGRIPVEHWTKDKLSRSVLESILLDRLEVADGDELRRLIDCLRRSGVLDERIAEARFAPGWRRRAALVALGRTRAPEALVALSEGLDSPDLETRIASVRGLGKLATAAAASQMLQRIEADTLDVPWNVVKNALLNCCASHPGVLIHHMYGAEEEGGKSRSERSSRIREMLARVLSEIADDASWNDLVLMAGDASAEVRASAARGLSRAAPEFALSPLAQLAGDREWFVRLRAVVALGSFTDRGGMQVLLRLLGDRNRLVRQRAAWALIRSTQLVPRIISGTVRSGDDYALQALVSELDRSGQYDATLAKLEDGRHSELIAALEAARGRLTPGGAPQEPAKREVGVA
ncbi:MAG: HEAT repeat domain-containing protein [Terriglobales bacterium]